MPVIAGLTLHNLWKFLADPPNTYARRGTEKRMSKNYRVKENTMTQLTMNVNMKKNLIITLTAAILLSISPLFQACSQEEIQEPKKSSLFIEELEMNLELMFQEVGAKLQQWEKGDKLKFKHIFSAAVKKVYPGLEAQDIFEESFRKAKARDIRAKAEITHPELVELFEQSESYEVAYEGVLNLIDQAEEETQNMYDYMAMREVLAFLEVNQEVITDYFYELREEGKMAKGCGWWKSWGKCLSGIVGGTITGSITGCVAGGVIAGQAGVVGGPIGVAGAAASGCTVVGIWGGIAGGFTGAAASCDGCEN